MPGFIGENITTSRIDLNGLFPDDELHLPSLRLQVTEPRDPCSKLAARVGIRGFERVSPGPVGRAYTAP